MPRLQDAQAAAHKKTLLADILGEEYYARLMAEARDERPSAKEGIDEVKQEVGKVDDGTADVAPCEVCGVLSKLRTRNTYLEAEIKRVNGLRDQLEYENARQTQLQNRLDDATFHINDLRKKLDERDELIALYRAADTVKETLGLLHDLRLAIGAANHGVTVEPSAQ